MHNSGAPGFGNSTKWKRLAGQRRILDGYSEKRAEYRNIGEVDGAAGGGNVCTTKWSDYGVVLLDD